MTPTWYDLLGLDRAAPADDIRTAWKTAIADLDPGDRRFRTLNEAAEVLLDPERRAEYDATLEPAEDSPAAPAPQADTPSDGSMETEAQQQARSAPQEERDSRTTDQRETPAELPTDPEPRTTTRPTIPAWLLAALAVLTALALAAAGYLYSQPSDDSVESSTGEAQAAAERAATTILAYDYRHLDADQSASEELMTTSYQKKYDALFSQIAANAPSLKVSVTVQLVASGIVRAGDDRTQVLVFVNRPTLRADKTAPEVFRDQVVMTMVKQGGDWLVDDMNTNQLAS
jgi:Mce-associated membrane protein